MKGYRVYINHITMTTGHVARSYRADVTDATLAALAPWLQAAIGSGQQHPLPGLPQYAAAAFVQDGGLVVTVYGSQPATGTRQPLATFGVAQRSRHGEALWALLVANFGAHAKARRPGEPWCAVALHPTLVLDPAATEWLGDFERCVAWAWLTRARAPASGK